MFERKCYQKLLEWKSSSQGRTALMIEGARRVGKTTLAREFARAEYDAHLIIGSRRKCWCKDHSALMLR